eukprot:TRINITY_DN4342_c1_g2_i2.p3 TRINITY_DN4342_c1_g2~~TRINITY_DN4342_c1_g2_i2.p3  ORF type:complete len:105 (-),score=6.90 TRINITY_DN4342_c1_g2_i2:23-337(-)
MEKNNKENLQSTEISCEHERKQEDKRFKKYPTEVEYSKQQHHVYCTFFNLIIYNLIDVQTMEYILLMDRLEYINIKHYNNQKIDIFPAQAFFLQFQIRSAPSIY